MKCKIANNHYHILFRSFSIIIQHLFRWLTESGHIPHIVKSSSSWNMFLYFSFFFYIDYLSSWRSTGKIPIVKMETHSCTNFDSTFFAFSGFVWYSVYVCVQRWKITQKKWFQETLLQFVIKHEASWKMEWNGIELKKSYQKLNKWKSCMKVKWRQDIWVITYKL